MYCSEQSGHVITFLLFVRKDWLQVSTKVNKVTYELTICLYVHGVCLKATLVILGVILTLFRSLNLRGPSTYSLMNVFCFLLGQFVEGAIPISQRRSGIRLIELSLEYLQQTDQHTV